MFEFHASFFKFLMSLESDGETLSLMLGQIPFIGKKARGLNKREELQSEGHFITYPLMAQKHRALRQFGPAEPTTATKGKGGVRLLPPSHARSLALSDSVPAARGTTTSTTTTTTTATIVAERPIPANSVRPTERQSENQSRDRFVSDGESAVVDGDENVRFLAVVTENCEKSLRGVGGLFQR